VVAENLADNEVMFAKAMTAKARRLGMKRSTFTNASGLPNRYQVTTARDMIILARALLRDFPQHYHYFSTRKFKFGRRQHGNHNNLLGRYAGTDGIKTGYINASGFNLVASAKRGPHRLIGVVFGGRTSRTRDRHMVTLLDRGFRKMKKRRPLIASLPPLPVRKPNLAAGGSDPIAMAAAGTSATDVSETPSELGSATVFGAGQRWGVQVGAYRELASARLRARQVAGVLPAMLTKTSVRIQAASEYNKAVYRTRFVGFEQGEAHRACKLLERRKVTCLVVAPNGRTQ
jgi:D-alanyl-D-alanine carboxypeptidase